MDLLPLINIVPILEYQFHQNNQHRTSLLSSSTMNQNRSAQHVQGSKAKERRMEGACHVGADCYFRRGFLEWERRLECDGLMTDWL